MAVHGASYCTGNNPLKPVASINELLYNHDCSDWKQLDSITFTLSFNEMLKREIESRQRLFLDFLYPSQGGFICRGQRRERCLESRRSWWNRDLSARLR